MTQKEISNQEFNEKLNHSNFSFFENENNFPSNYGQKYKTCGKLRINKKLSPNSLYNDDFRLLCSAHHFKFTQKKNINFNDVLPLSQILICKLSEICRFSLNGI